jgi:hypothetical protein
MILHHAVVWTTLVVGAIGAAAAEKSTALIRRSMQEETDCGLCTNGGECTEGALDGNTVTLTCICVDGYGGSGCEIDYSICDEVAARIGDATSKTAIRAVLQDTVIATEQQRTTVSDGDHRSFACTAWLGLVAQGQNVSLLLECSHAVLWVCLSVSLAMHAAMPFVCMLLPLSVRMGVAESAAAE